MKPNHRLAAILSFVLVMSLASVYVRGDRARLLENRSVALPSYAMLDESAEPVLASNGRVGYISAVTGGSVIAFNTASGKMLSTMVVGETAGSLSILETGGRILLAAPAVNDPAGGHPATVTILDATNPRQFDLRALLVLPPEAHITPATRALLTRDGRYCLIASSLEQPALFAFEVETGQIVSRLELEGRPSQMAMHEDADGARLAIASSAANWLSLVTLDGAGHLALAAGFSPEGMSFDAANNPAFGSDGRVVYIAAAEGDALLAVDAASGALIDHAPVSGPQRVTVGRDGDGDLIGVARIRRPAQNKPGGATIFKKAGERLARQAEFEPPDGIDFSRANNLAFDAAGEVAFIGSKSGMLFAFAVATGELESYQSVGGELRRLSLSRRGNLLAAVRSSQASDEVVIVKFDLVEPADESAPAPVIDSLQPNTVEQGRARNLRLRVRGRNFGDGAALLVNGVEMAAEPVGGGQVLEARLPRSLFGQAGDIQIQVKAAGGATSAAAALRVVRPADPIVEKLRPSEIAGPAAAFVLKVKGAGFRATSAVFIGGVRLETERLSERLLQARVPESVAGKVAVYKVQVRDTAVPGVVSNEGEFAVFGPRVREVRPTVSEIVAGAGGFGLRIFGANFRPGAVVEVNGEAIPEGKIRRASMKVIRLGMPRRFAENAGKLAVVVRNPDGSASEPQEIEALAPEISGFQPGPVFAGQQDIKVSIQGKRFRRGARVFVAGGAGGALQLPRRHVRFRSSTRIVLQLTEEANRLLTQPGALRVQVVNPNQGDGVPSAEAELKLLGPEISAALVRPIEGDPGRSRIVIQGANFRPGARVEFLKGSAVVRRQDPEKFKADRLTLSLGNRKLAALGAFEVRVVNPGKVASNTAGPQPDATVESRD